MKCENCSNDQCFLTNKVNQTSSLYGNGGCQILAKHFKYQDCSNSITGNKASTTKTGHPWVELELSLGIIYLSLIYLSEEQAQTNCLSIDLKELDSKNLSWVQR